MAFLIILKRNDFLGVGKKLVTTESHTFLASKKYLMLIRREKIFPFNSFFKNRLTQKLFFFFSFKGLYIRQQFQKKLCDHIHDVIYGSYLSNGILHLIFEQISCNEIYKYYILKINGELHMRRFFKFLAEGCKNISIEPQTKMPKFSQKIPSQTEDIN